MDVLSPMISKAGKRYPLHKGHVSVMPNALSGDLLYKLQQCLTETDFPDLEHQLHRVECQNPDLQLYTVRGWIPPHVDDVPISLGERVATLGLVIEDSLGSNLIQNDRQPGIPLSPGCVYRIDPLRMHGTEPSLSMEDRRYQSGLFAFVAADFSVHNEPDPKEFAQDIARELLLDRMTDFQEDGK